MKGNKRNRRKLHLQLDCVAGVKRGRGRGNLGAREHVGRAREKGKEPSSLLPRAWSRALVPFPFPFERPPRKLTCCSGSRQRECMRTAQIGPDLRLVCCGPFVKTHSSVIPPFQLQYYLAKILQDNAFFTRLLRFSQTCEL